VEQQKPDALSDLAPLDGANGEKLPAAAPEVSRIQDLIDLIKESAEKLAGDQTSRGDLKLISRALRELRYAFKVFQPYRTRRKVSIFGSARTQPDELAYQQAVAFGRNMAAHDWLIVTGAASGIMEAGHIGAGREKSMGLNIMLPFEQSSNSVIAGDPKLVHMKYFFTRKLMFVKECDAVCNLPGGFGTMDEAFEVLTLVQTGKRDLVPMVFLDAPGGTFWQEWREFIERQLLGHRLISPEDFSLFRITDSVDEAVQEVLKFYRVYHSMRYVRNKLVVRLQAAPSAEQLAHLNEHFADILSSGQFASRDFMPEERDDELVIHLPRLVFHFNRRNLGRLRQMVDYLNENVAVEARVA
jgi:uncharacterized protein (TIGR00730 family)